MGQIGRKRRESKGGEQGRLGKTKENQPKKSANPTAAQGQRSSLGEARGDEEDVWSKRPTLTPQGLPEGNEQRASPSLHTQTTDPGPPGGHCAPEAPSPWVGTTGRQRASQHCQENRPNRLKHIHFSAT